jgi:hypothetical protein
MFDLWYDWKIFKMDFGGFADVSFGLLALPGLEEAFLANDLTVTGSYKEGGGIEGHVDLYVIPEPGTLVLLGMGALAGLLFWRRRRAA